MKPLLPTLKERQRYVTYHIITAHPLGNDISESLLQKLASILGVFGSAKAGLLSISYHQGTQTGILRCNHDQVEQVRAALIMVTHIGRTPVCIRTLGTSGMLNKAKLFVPEAARRTKKESTKGLGRKQHATDAAPNDGV